MTVARDDIADVVDVASDLRQFLMAAIVIETNGRLGDCRDEWLPLESLQPVAAGIKLARFTERGAEITNHEPPRRTVPWLGQLVHHVVVVLEVGAVQHQQHYEQDYR